jgi:hypothetical protein
MKKYAEQLSEIIKAIETSIAKGESNGSNKAMLELSNVVLGLTEEIEGNKFVVINEKINEFTEERRKNILIGNTPLTLLSGGKLVIHVLPLASFDPNIFHAPYDISSLIKKRIELKPIYGSSWGDKFDKDGLVVVSNETSGSYVRVFNNGVLEIVDSGMLSHGSMIPTGIFEQKIIGALKSYLNVLKEIGITYPAIIKISLHNVKDYIVGVDPARFHSMDAHPIITDSLYLTETLLEDVGVELSASLKPSFDNLWQSGGWSRSHNYNDQGEWIGGNSY